MDAARRSVEHASPKAKIAAVGGHEPVAPIVVGRGDPDDRLDEVDRAGGSLEGGVAVGEDPAVGGDEPIPAIVLGRGDADDRVGQRHARRRTEGLRVPEFSHRTRRARQPEVARPSAGSHGRPGLPCSDVAAAPTGPNSPHAEHHPAPRARWRSRPHHGPPSDVVTGAPRSCMIAELCTRSRPSPPSLTTPRLPPRNPAIHPHGPKDTQI